MNVSVEQVNIFAAEREETEWITKGVPLKDIIVSGLLFDQRQRISDVTPNYLNHL